MLFNGQQWDEAEGLYFNRARYYAPRQGTRRSVANPVSMGADVEALFQGNNSTVTLRATGTGHVFRKQAAPDLLDREERVLRALDGGLAGLRAPRVVGRDGEALLTAALPGVNLAIVFAQAEGDTARRERLAAEFGRALRGIHDAPPPLPRPDGDWLDDATVRAIDAAALFEGAALDNPHSPLHGRRADAVAEWAKKERPEVATEPVFGHGDWCLPNVLVEDERITGVIDWPAGGWLDGRYDLATGLWTLRYNAGHDPAINGYERRFLDGYGYGAERESLRLFEALYALIGWM